MKKIGLSICLFLLFLSFEPIKGCSGFLLSGDSTLFVGKNTDWTNWKSKVWFTPSKDGHYGYVSFGFDNFYTVDGMNEAGLVISHFGGPLKKIRRSRHKPHYSGNLSEKILAECGSVEEALALLNRYFLGQFHNGMVFLADKKGHSVIVEGDAIIPKKGTHQICTNFYQSRYMRGSYPCWRYNLLNRELANSYRYSMAFVESLLQKVFQDITQYTLIYEPLKGEIHAFLFQDLTFKKTFYLASELKKGPTRYNLFPFFPEESRYYNTFIKRQTPQNNPLILIFLILSGLFYLATIVGWLFQKWAQFEQKKELTARNREFWLFRLFSSGMASLFLIYLISLLFYKEAFYLGIPTSLEGFPFIIKLMVHIPFVTLILSLPMVVINIWLPLGKYGTIIQRWHFTFLTITYLLMIGLWWYWGFMKVFPF